MNSPTVRYKSHRFFAEVIIHAMCLYHRFPFSLALVEDILAARGVIVTHQTIRLWAEKFGWRFDNDIQRPAGRFGDKWHHKEVAISIFSEKHWLWRAVKRDGFVLDEIVQSR